MIRATELGGRAVVDMDAAEQVGKVEKVILDPEARCVAGFQVAHGRSLLGSPTRVNLPASSVHSIGPDAITVHGSVVMSDLTRLASLPRVNDVLGRKVVSEDGRLLGKVDDVLIDGETGGIVGYALSHDSPTSYLRADADFRAGSKLIVAPDSAIMSELDPENDS